MWNRSRWGLRFCAWFVVQRALCSKHSLFLLRVCLLLSVVDCFKRLASGAYVVASKCTPYSLELRSTRRTGTFKGTSPVSP